MSCKKGHPVYIFCQFQSSYKETKVVVWFFFFLTKVHKLEEKSPPWQKVEKANFLDNLWAIGNVANL